MKYNWYVRYSFQQCICSYIALQQNQNQRLQSLDECDRQLSLHGGCTFFDYGVPDTKCDEGNRVLGWDYFHPIDINWALMNFKEYNINNGYFISNVDPKQVMDDIYSAIQQLDKIQKEDI